MLNLGTINGVNLSLISPFTSSNGDIYYFVDGNGDRSPTDTPGATYDAILRQRLDDLFNSGSDTNATSRSVVIEVSDVSVCETNRGTRLKEGFGSSFNLRSEDEIEIQSTQGHCTAGGQRHPKSY